MLTSVSVQQLLRFASYLSKDEFELICHEINMMTRKYEGVSQSVRRGEKTADEAGFCLVDV